MAFKNLETLYNEKVNELYSTAKTKFENGRASTGRNDEPLIVRRPGEGYFTVADRIGGRSTPVNSSLQDVKRLTLFTLSVRGVAFLAKQQLLQTGNTFEQTRIINPAFAVGNAVPFLHIRRHLRPLRGLVGKTDTSQANVRKLGQLQKSTYDSFIKTPSIGGFLKKISGPIASTISAVTAKKNVGEEFGYDETGWKQSRPELARKIFYPGLGLVNKTFKHGGKVETQTFTTIRYGMLSRPTEPISRKYTTYLNITNDSEQWAPLIYRRKVSFGTPFSNQVGDISRGDPVISEIAEAKSLLKFYTKFKFDDTDDNIPALLSDQNENFSTENLLDTYDTVTLDDKRTTSLIFEDAPHLTAGNTIPIVLDEAKLQYGVLDKTAWYEENGGTPGELMPFLKYFRGDAESITDGGQFDVTNPSTTNAKSLALNPDGTRKKISYIKDPANINELLDRNVLEPYKYINGADDGFEDAITVSFAIGKNDHIKFRAFITDLTENSSPQYQSLQYIGRVEKFINYTGVQREASFKLSVLAFSKDELESVWRRINYLTGMTFPYGFTRGVLQPNIVRLTIGNVYKDQPGYISSLSKTFNQISETWDLDNEVPIGASMDMKFTIIEKSTMVADSPFHGITENSPGFSPTLNIAQQLNTLDPNNFPRGAAQTTRVEQRAPTIPTADLNRRVNVLPPPGVIQIPTVNVPIPEINLARPQTPIRFGGG